MKFNFFKKLLPRLKIRSAASLFAYTSLIVVFTYSSFSNAQQAIQILQTGSVMGFRHYEGKQIWDNLHVGEKLVLVREPENAFDSQAIRVEWQGHKLGYVPKADNVDLARIMDNGTNVEARIIALNPSRRPNNRVTFEVFLGAK